MTRISILITLLVLMPILLTGCGKKKAAPVRSSVRTIEYDHGYLGGDKQKSTKNASGFDTDSSDWKLKGSAPPQ